MDANGHTMNGYHANGHYENGDTFANGYQTEGGPREEFLKKVFDLLLKECVTNGTSTEGKVIEFLHPKALEKQLDLHLPEQGETEAKLLNLCRDTIRYSVKTGHPHFFNQLYQGQDVYALAGACLTEALNTSQYTFEVAPVFTLMEQVVLGKMLSIVGYEGGDGIFCPGGSISNMYALNLARYDKFPAGKEDGMYGLPRMQVFTSEQSHYSISKGAALLGLGVNNVVKVPCDSVGKMIPEQLDIMLTDAKERDIVPLMVNATSGTTVAGAYDPLEDIAAVCEKHGVWMHIDMIWGGSVILSRKYKHLVKGLDRADSIAWNPHKMMGVPLQCSAFLTSHENMLQHCHCANAKYLFQQDKFYDVSYDTGDKSIQCGRKIDVFKIWLMWKARGDEGLEAGIDNLFGCAEYLTTKLRNTEGFRLVFDKPECTNVCFWYIPPNLRGQPETPEWWQQLSKVAPTIKERMMLKGSMLVGYQPLGSKVNFFRMVLANHSLERCHMDFAMEEIDRLGQDI